MTAKLFPPEPSSEDRVLQVSEEVVRCAVNSFPVGSSGGPNCLLPQHLKDLIGVNGDPEMLSSLTNFVNKVLEGNLPVSIAQIFYGGSLIALKKKDGGIRPITIGYTLRRLVAKCANSAVIDRIAALLSPIQVGVGVKGGARQR